ncbi:CD209 antigen-like protein C, partial [Lampris incognitus]|uniref:CD209 antigen-like protein C n=1 Tax=Lampris incognitus TaxID=2546036 RepID=UPI0024B63554
IIFAVLITLFVGAVLAQAKFLPALVAEYKILNLEIERDDTIHQVNLTSTQQKLELCSTSKTNVAAEARQLRTILSLKEVPLCDLDTLQCRRCPLGWEEHRSQCYILSLHTKNWQASRRECLDMGADLAVIRDEEDQVFLINFTVQFYQRRPELGFLGAWIGLQDLVQEGEYMWVNGQGLQPQHIYWRTREPNNYVADWDEDQAGQDCVSFVTLGERNVDKPLNTWDDVVCAGGRHFICETPALGL